MTMGKRGALCAILAFGGCGGDEPVVLLLNPLTPELERSPCGILLAPPERMGMATWYGHEHRTPGPNSPDPLELVAVHTFAATNAGEVEYVLTSTTRGVGDAVAVVEAFRCDPVLRAAELRFRLHALPSIGSAVLGAQGECRYYADPRFNTDLNAYWDCESVAMAPGQYTYPGRDGYSWTPPEPRLDTTDGHYLLGQPFDRWSFDLHHGAWGLATYGGWGVQGWPVGGDLWPGSTPNDAPAPYLVDVRFHNPGGITPQSRPVNRSPSRARDAACGPFSAAQWPASATVFQPAGAGHPWSVISFGWTSSDAGRPGEPVDPALAPGYFAVAHVARHLSRWPFIDALDCTDPTWVRRVARSSEAGFEVFAVPEAVHPRDPSPRSELDDGAWRWSIGREERQDTPTGPVLGLGYTRTRHTPPCAPDEACTESGLLMYGVGPVPDFGTRWTLEHFHLGPELETGPL